VGLRGVAFEFFRLCFLGAIRGDCRGRQKRDQSSWLVSTSHDREGSTHDKEGSTHDREGFSHDREGFSHDREGFSHDREGFSHDRDAGTPSGVASRLAKRCTSLFSI
jgi:hypothetical protein